MHPDEQTVIKQIEDVYRARVQTQGDPVYITEIRIALRHIARDELDVALTELERRNGVNLIPESDQNTLTPADREAALIHDSESKHILMMSGYGINGRTLSRAA